jgi:UDP-glucuronate 4-epimerase
VTVLITGVAGFVGSALARRLVVDGEEVVGVDCLTDYYDPSLKKDNLSTIPADGFSFVSEDVNTADLDSLLAGVSVVFHEAGQPGVRKSWGEDFATYVDANVLATQRLLEAARRSRDLQRLVYASSSSVYGNALSYPTTENDVPRPHSPYGVTKLAAEHLCSLYASNFGVPTVSLRYFTVYGPGQRPDMAFNRFIRATLAGEPIEVFGTGEQVRDFTFVDDVVDANLRAAAHDVRPGSMYNVSGGTSISVNEVLDVLSDIAGAPI